MTLVSFQSLLPSLSNFSFSVFLSNLFFCSLYVGLSAFGSAGFMGYIVLWIWVVFNLPSGSGHVTLKPLWLLSPVRSVVLTGAMWDCLRGCSQDGLVKTVSGFVDVEVVSLGCLPVFISKAYVTLERLWAATSFYNPPQRSCESLLV